MPSKIHRPLSLRLPVCCATGVALTDARRTSVPRTVPDAYRRDGDRFQRVGRATRPPTLGDVLNQAMRLRMQTTEAAANAMGVTTAEVLAWSADGPPPDREHEAVLAAYLEVDERQLRALVLRSQMRRAQARIRN